MGEKNKGKREFTPKQQRVVDCFDGDYIATAKNAGVTHGYVKRLCTDVSYRHIQEAIRSRNSKKSSKIGKIIASRKERQAFWTGVFTGEIVSTIKTVQGDGIKTERIIQPKMSDRLKASELLGKSEADFTENVKHGGDLKITGVDINLIKADNEDNS